MSEQTQELDTLSTTIGQALKNAREKLQLSADDIADHLRVSKEMVEKIENDQLEKREMTVFVRGYIRGYAKRVNVNNDHVETYFLSIGLTKRPSKVNPVNFEIKKSVSKVNYMRWISVAIVALIIVLVLMWSLSGSNNQTPQNVNPAVTTATPTAAAITTATPAAKTTTTAKTKKQ